MVEAIQVATDNYDEICEFVGRQLDAGWSGDIGKTLSNVELRMREGVFAIIVGDWIIQDVKGEFCPCDTDDFEATYEKVDQ